MKSFPDELGKMGFVFNFITYGGHQIDGLAGEEFATALKEDGMLALARLQRKLRLINSPYKTPQAYIGGPRVDGILMATSGRTATSKAMGKGSTHFQHLVQTEVPPSVLEGWLAAWAEQNGHRDRLAAKLKPHTMGQDVLELNVLEDGRKVAEVIFAEITDRRGYCIISIRDQKTFDTRFRRKRLITLMHVFLLHRYKARSVHYVSPTEDSDTHTRRMKELGIFKEVNTEVGQITVARVNETRIEALVAEDQLELRKLIARQ